jgi:hypothetical protein
MIIPAIVYCIMTNGTAPSGTTPNENWPSILCRFCFDSIPGLDGQNVCGIIDLEESQ